MFDHAFILCFELRFFISFNGIYLPPRDFGWRMRVPFILKTRHCFEFLLLAGTVNKVITLMPMHFCVNRGLYF